ncbi:MAG: hypothetical protein HOK62_06185, partial [Verrucomicrobiales bacterium]|nr:hypothetical protein [Verrucomicrobiales bacterium]
MSNKPQFGFPKKQGLYDPANEKDSCGVGFVAHVKGVPSHQIVLDAIQMLKNMDHRGACGCEANTGDGSGILTGLPWGATSDVTSDFLLSSGAAGAKITGWSYIVALAGTYYDGMRTSSTTSDLTPYVNGVDGATFDNIEIHYTAVRSTAPSSRIPHPVVVNSYDVYDKIQLTNL